MDAELDNSAFAEEVAERLALAFDDMVTATHEAGYRSVPVYPEGRAAVKEHIRGLVMRELADGLLTREMIAEDLERAAMNVLADFLPKPT